MSQNKIQILDNIAIEHSYSSWGECMYDAHEHSQIEYTCQAMEEYAKQELAKERERYDNLYSQFKEVCRQVEINKDKLERYENAYAEEVTKNVELTQALEAKLRDDLRQSEIF